MVFWFGQYTERLDRFRMFDKVGLVWAYSAFVASLTILTASINLNLYSAPSWLLFGGAPDLDQAERRWLKELMELRTCSVLEVRQCQGKSVHVGPVSDSEHDVLTLLRLHSRQLLLDGTCWLGFTWPVAANSHSLLCCVLSFGEILFSCWANSLASLEWRWINLY